MCCTWTEFLSAGPTRSCDFLHIFPVASKALASCGSQERVLQMRLRIVVHVAAAVFEPRLEHGGTWAGTWPSSRHDNTRWWAIRDDRRASRSGTPFGFRKVCVFLKADYMEFINTLGLMSFQTRNSQLPWQLADCPQAGQTIRGLPPSLNWSCDVFIRMSIVICWMLVCCG